MFNTNAYHALNGVSFRFAWPGREVNIAHAITTTINSIGNHHCRRVTQHAFEISLFRITIVYGDAFSHVET
jgi:hypothetical protein